VNRRGFLQGILAAGIAPFVVLMPVTAPRIYRTGMAFGMVQPITIHQPIWVPADITVKELLIRSTYDSNDTQQQIMRVLAQSHGIKPPFNAARGVK